MKIAYLPGFSLKNKTEGEVIASDLISEGFDVYFHHWPHWNDETLKPDWDEETEKVISQISTYESILIGKSIGTFVALKIINSNKINIKEVILMGIPVNDFDNQDEYNLYSQTLSSLKSPLTVIQNISDDHGSSEQVKELLKDANYKLIEKDRNDHRYNYSQDLIKIIQST